MDNEFRCPICGGELEYYDKTNSIMRCINCGNKTTIDLKFSNIDDKTIKEHIESNSLIEKISKEEIVKNKQKQKNRVVLTIARQYGVILSVLLLMFIVSYLICDLKNVIKIEFLNKSILLGIGIVSSVFAIALSKIKSNSFAKSVLLLCVSFILFTAITAIVLWLSFFV